MCQIHASSSSLSGEASTAAAAEAAPKSRDGIIPHALGLFDAHCHPTDTMASIASIHPMRAQGLTIMATRSQDQDLVASVAADHPLLPTATAIDDLVPPQQQQQQQSFVVPAFGWHPWFSHQLLDDVTPDKPTRVKLFDGRDPSDIKREHYGKVLTPSPDQATIDVLPQPLLLSDFLAATRQRLLNHPRALVGEAGLDKAFRLPDPSSSSHERVEDDGLTPGGREGRRLSPYRVVMGHQQAVLAAQLSLAGELGRAVSLHGVQAHGVLFDTVARTWKGHELDVPTRRERRMVAPGAEDDFDYASTSDEDGSGDDDGKKDRPRVPKPRRKRRPPVGNKPFPPRVCLHSFSGSVELLKQYLTPDTPCKVFASFSTAVNLGTEGARAKLEEVVRALPDHRLLVESDLHRAGDEMDDRLEDMYRIVCEIKGWGLEEGVKRIRSNYDEFIFG